MKIDLGIGVDGRPQSLFHLLLGGDQQITSTCLHVLCSLSRSQYIFVSRIDSLRFINRLPNKSRAAKVEIKSVLANKRTLTAAVFIFKL